VPHGGTPLSKEIFVKVVEIIALITTVISGASIIVFVLLHSGKGAGLSEMFGGMMPVTSSGTSIVEKNLDRITIVSAIVFGVSLLVLMIISA
jgi:preprotein translocase subunit SecG